MAKRLSAMPQSARKYRNGFRPTFHSQEIGAFYEKVRRWRKPKRVFVNSMSDTMDPGFSDAQIRQVIQVAVDWPRHTFLFLSKRPERYSDFEWPQNSWLGTTVTNQADLEERAGHLVGPRGKGATFLSVEPILGYMKLGNHKVSWVIIGAQTGPKAMRPKQRWVGDLTWQARQMGAAIFHKPSLEKHFGSDFQRREFPQ
jgi:protein gp37